MKLRLFERAIVALGLVKPTVKGIADAIRDNPETFRMRSGRGTFSWVTHRSEVFSVLRFDDEDKAVPVFRVVNKLGNELITLTWWDRLVLALAWPDHLLPEYHFNPCLLSYYAHD
jgi:hypothetical protein